MTTIKVCVGVGTNQFFPEYVTIELPSEPIQGGPCNFDHNGECLICDCWSSNCAYSRYVNQDYTFESREELEKMFNHHV